jgi:hypothetical protein
VETLPSSAFDSASERARVEMLLSRYNDGLKMSPLLDHDFALLARERTARRPWRTYLFIPLARAAALWLTPHIELLPYSGELWPPGDRWRSNSVDFGVTLTLGILNILLIGLALVGAWRCGSKPGLALALAFVAIRTAFLTQRHTIEPRYMIVCVPIMLALASEAWVVAQPQLSEVRSASLFASDEAS